MTVHACTIIARNYLPFARVLARSLRAQHPDGRFTVLIIDEPVGSVDRSAEPFQVVGLDDLPEPPADLHRMALYYDLTELATAVKPWLLQLLLDGGASEAMYLDPDIRVFAPLDDIVASAASTGIVLTPHATAPIPRDGRMVDETSILAAGIYNLGFIAVGSTARPFLEFWKERLRRECIIAPERMRFVDQRWIDFVPGMFDTAILRDPTYNVAYWNLHDRHLRGSDAGWTVNGSPLHFFHFSGYRPDVPHLLSKHQGDRPRVLLSEHPELVALCGEYGAELVAHGFGVDDRIPYGIDTLANGLPVDEVVRSYYRDWVTTAGEGGTDPPPDPFDADGADALLTWITEVAPATEGPARLSRYHATRYSLDPGLRARFPDPQGADYAAVVAWTRAEAAAGRLDPRLVQQPVDVVAGPPVPSPSRPRRPRPGIRVAGYLRAEMGVGQLGRLTADVVEAAGVASSHHVVTRTKSRQEHRFTARRADDVNVNIVCVNADELPGFAERVGPEFFESRYTIGLWAWEVPVFPERFAAAFAHVDEVWGCSSFVRDAIATTSPKPVFAFPLPVTAPPAAAGLDRAALGIAPGFVFLFCFDLLSVMERKNPVGLVEAFTDAFAPGEGPVLVIKTMNGDTHVMDMERLRLAAQGRPDVVLIDRILSAQDNAALMAECDCYVSLHHSEGFGLTMAEAMALGKPVIATGYSGNLDFMDADTAYLVPWSPGRIPAGCDPYPPGEQWADPDLGEASRLMRHVYENRDEAMATGRRAQAAVLEHHSVRARAPFVLERFAAAQDVLRARRRRRLVRAMVPTAVLRLARRASPSPQGGTAALASGPGALVPGAAERPHAVWSDSMLERLTRPATHDAATLEVTRTAHDDADAPAASERS